MGVKRSDCFYQAFVYWFHIQHQMEDIVVIQTH